MHIAEQVNPRSIALEQQLKKSGYLIVGENKH